MRCVVGRHDHLDDERAARTGAIASRTRVRIASACGSRPVVDDVREQVGVGARGHRLEEVAGRRSRSARRASPSSADGCATVRGRSNSTPCSAGWRRSTSASSVPLPPPTSTRRCTPAKSYASATACGSPALMTRHERVELGGVVRVLREVLEHRAAVRERPSPAARSRPRDPSCGDRRLGPTAGVRRGSPAASPSGVSVQPRASELSRPEAGESRAAAGAASARACRWRPRAPRSCADRRRSRATDLVVRGDAQHLRRRARPATCARTCTGAGSVGAVCA